MRPVDVSVEAGTATATMLLNVAVIPSQRVSDGAAKISHQLADRGGLFEVDNRTRHAHLTLYMARFCKARLPEIKADLVRETSRIRSFDVEHTGYFVTPGNYHEISYRRNDILFRVHKTMTRTICGHRYLPGNPVVENYFGEYTESQRINVRDVGYDLAGQLYRPHITITRFEADVAAEPPVPSDDLSFTATMIGLFEADHLGAARRLIDRFDLT